ncbi:PREDICTED: major pollen allergen Ole e 6-like [Ipomoea nil]|uniref:major pollen allergen Ole e 6-like n=1 Tax=Ipomoea nil TaxID=35883 RepID=UPI000901F379|nr:PREDICTED: major pollen allergen Ole e 6-like [Ipomoea nil]
MATNKKFFAVFVLCMVVLSVLTFTRVEADDEEYEKCKEKCETECKGEGDGDTVCAMKCDTSCGANVVKDKVSGMMS